MKATLRENRKLAILLVVTALVLCGSVGLVGVSVSLWANEQHVIDRRVCVAINRFDVVVIQTLRRSRSNLPKVAYFRAHPGEMRTQRAEITREIRLFSPTHCK